MNLNLLIALDAMLEEKSVTRAAIRLRVSQPAMSAGLQSLRYHFSDQLLEKVGRNLQLTPRAKEIVQPLRALLADLRNAIDASTIFDPKTTRRTFRIAVSSFVAELLVPALVRRLAEEAPGISFEIQNLISDMFARLNNGVLDLCIAASGRAFFDPVYVQNEIVSECLFQDPLVFVADIANGIPDAFDEEILTSANLVVVRVGENIRSVVEHALEASDANPHIVAIVPSYNLALQMVSGSDLLTVARRRLIEAHPQRDRLRTIASFIAFPLLEDSLIWHQRSDRDAGHIWLRKFVRDVTAELDL